MRHATVKGGERFGVLLVSVRARSLCERDQVLVGLRGQRLDLRTFGRVELALPLGQGVMEDPGVVDGIAGVLLDRHPVEGGLEQ